MTKAVLSRAGWLAVCVCSVLLSGSGATEQVVEKPSLVAALLLSWVGTPGYRRDGVSPNRGLPNETVFRFKVEARDAAGDEPHFVRLILQRNGVRWRQFDMLPGDGAMETGRVYRISRRLPLGNYTYRFKARDEDGPAGGIATRRQYGPIMDSPPFLTWLHELGYEDDGCDPDTGRPNATRFRFRVIYYDYDGDMPERMRVVLRRNGAFYRSLTMSPLTTFIDPVQGIVYRAGRSLPAGDYAYRFHTRDDDGDAVGGPSAWKAGPTVSDGAGSAVVSTLAAVPTNAGAQITFSLSSAAQVQARILNIAGRPVKTLCRANDCEAGANRLSWNAQSDQGLPVPNGTYLVEVMARAGDATSSRAVVPLRLHR